MNAMVERSAVKILVLDDESFMLKLLNRILSNLGYTAVTLCDSGRAALERIVEGAPDVILLDLNMPRKNGTECLHEIKTNPKLQALPVVIYSTSLHEEIADLGLVSFHLVERGPDVRLCVR